METGKVKVLSPRYMSNFTCLGNQCEDTCCKYWRIDIDYQTYKRYTKITDPKLRYLIGEYVLKNKNPDHKLKYAMFKLKEDGHCAFLDEEGLCMFQRRYGPGYLSQVCMTYPRRHVLLDGTLERSGTVSCPELARIMLFNNEPMEFCEFTEESEHGYFWEMAMNTSDADITQRPILKYLWPLRNLCIQIIQNRSLSIRERLILLGLFSNKLNTLDEEGKWDEVQQLIERYRRILQSEDVRSMLVQIPADGYLQFKAIMEMVVLRLKMSDTSPTFKTVLEQFKLGIGYYDDITMEQAFINYSMIRSEYTDLFDKQYPQVFENYLVNYVFSKVYPLKPSNHVFENYIALVVDYAITRMFLVGVGAYHKKFDDEIVQKVFTGIALTVEHNMPYVEAMVDHIKSFSGGILAYTTILVQN